MNNQKRSWGQFEQSIEGPMDETLVKVGTQDLVGRFRSKHDLYTYFTEIFSYYMPPIEGVNRDYFKQIFKGEKKLLKMADDKMTKVPKYDELSVRQIYKGIKDDADLLQFLPDMDEKQKPIDRTYFFNVVNTLQPDYLSFLVKATQEKRNMADDGTNKNDFILISDDWLSQITSHPFISKKNGRALQLMKQSAKIFKARRQKPNPIPVTSLKRFKSSEGPGSASKQSFNTNQLMIDNTGNNNSQDYNHDGIAQTISKLRFNI